MRFLKKWQMESHLTTVQQDFSHLSLYFSVTALHFFFVSLHFPNVHPQTHPVWISLPFPSLLIYLSLYDECLLLLSQFSYLSISLSKWLSGKESTCWRRIRGFDPWVRKIPQRRKWQHTPVFLLGKSHGQRSLEGYIQWGCKELNERAHTHTHTSIHFRQNQSWGDCKISREPSSLIEWVVGWGWDGGR